jgi:23S rRNA pseudouridine1911/1915/1917 synthase
MSADDGALVIIADALEAGRRLDQVVAGHLTDGSRNFAARLIKKGHVLVDGLKKKPAYRPHIGETISAKIPPPLKISLRPEPIPIDILFEDQDLLVVNKQAGLVMHPSPGHASGTLVNALLHHCPDLGGIAGVLRPGIVHRLDKETTGALVVAKTDAAHKHLSAQFKDRSVSKTYIGIVHGEMAQKTGRISLPIGRHPLNRKKMSTMAPISRPAETRWRTLKCQDGLSLMEFDLKTGRTHQIRVHCTALGHPLVGDPVYTRRKISHSLPAETREAIKRISRQMLHAARLGLIHPISVQKMTFKAPLPQDMAELINNLGLATP